LESGFGRFDGELAIRLPDGCILEGRIDRIDEWTDYLRVIDYKRGGKTLKLSEAYYGLRLQLPVYLAAAMKQTGGKSAGVYYFTLSEGILPTQSVDPNAVEAERRKNFRMEGLLPDDKDLLRAMSPRFEDVLKVRIAQGGGFYKGTVAASERDFTNLTRCAIRRAGEHVSSIRSGRCVAAPARMEMSDPCKYCDYKSICQFDDRLDARRIRKFKPIPAEEVLEKLREEEDE
jgi:ATP-dependent helicase/nuclease subunit B